MVPIDVYYILFGRPWQHDNKIVHDLKKKEKDNFGLLKEEIKPKPLPREGRGLISSPLPNL